MSVFNKPDSFGDSINNYFFTGENQPAQKRMFYALFFTIFTVIALGIDSVFFTKHYFDARQITNLLAIVYFSLFFFASNSHLRKLMFIMVFLSYFGELIFCKWLAMYAYRSNDIPLYVPFGHAIVYASGYVFSESSWAIKNEKALRTFFAVFFMVFCSLDYSQPALASCRLMAWPISWCSAGVGWKLSE